MDPFLSESTSSNYFIPQNRSYTNQKYSSVKSSVAIQANFYDFQESLRQYEELLEENFHLKNKLFKENNLHINPHQNIRNIQFSQQKENTDSFDHSKLLRQNSFKCMNTNRHDNQSSLMKSRMTGSTLSQSKYQQSFKENDMQMWSIKHRNNFLEQKLHNLENQFQKQSDAINQVMSSEKWKNRFDCKESTCYQDKYIKLLRVKSPVLLD